MGARILVGFDPRRPDWAPVQFAVLMSRVTGAPVVTASVEAADATPHEPVDEDLVEDCTAALEDVEAELRALNLRFVCLRLRGRSATQALHDEAARVDTGLLVVGSARRSGAGRVALGSTAQSLFHGAPCPVAAVPLSWVEQPLIGTIGAAYVDSPEGLEALRSAHALARRAGARLRVVSVLRVTPKMHLETETAREGQLGKSLETVEGEHKWRVEQQLRAALEELGGDVASEIDVVVGDPDGDPADHLIATSEHLDVMFCGSRGYGPLRAVLLGSVSSRLAAGSRCPVIVVPRGIRSSLDALLSEASREETPA